ncbi:IS5 family transposase [Pontibacter sp. G13]|uniref:IS5 family transposase n=1 Tax=Pontibacter sp. G13 TaxID=3074898 RepID=UPI00288BAA97|nr:IS5 family transposase [Pontibacter sp. G13]WNJ19627.1 IS5 family transposase [Pontibacter sp. G13]
MTIQSIGKSTINRQIVRHLSRRKRGPKPKVEYWRIVKAILFKLKTGVQWRELPMSAFSPKVKISWNTALYHFNKWSKDGSWERLWLAILKAEKKHLDMSSVQFDGSHTLAKNGGSAVSYQGRKKARTTNMLILADSQGIPLACSDPIKGNHNDLFEVEKWLSKILATLKAAGIETEGLFLNADAGFDGENFRSFCEAQGVIMNAPPNKRNSKGFDENEYLFDDELYRCRFVIERTNAWIDGFKNLIIRYSVNPMNWKSWHLIAFSIIFLRNVPGGWVKP